MAVLSEVVHVAVRFFVGNARVIKAYLSSGDEE